jgi:hypothetical protein
VKEHDLKCWPEFFERLLDYSKTFEFRKNDRDYQPGDLLHLREFEPPQSGPFAYCGDYTGRTCDRLVTYVLRGSDGWGPGLAEDYCILGLLDPRVKELRDQSAGWQREHAYLARRWNDIERDGGRQMEQRLQAALARAKELEDELARTRGL